MTRESFLVPDSHERKIEAVFKDKYFWGVNHIALLVMMNKLDLLGRDLSTESPLKARLTEASESLDFIDRVIYNRMKNRLLRRPEMKSYSLLANYSNPKLIDPISFAELDLISTGTDITDDISIQVRSNTARGYANAYYTPYFVEIRRNTIEFTDDYHRYPGFGLSLKLARSGSCFADLVLDHVQMQREHPLQFKLHDEPAITTQPFGKSRFKQAVAQLVQQLDNTGVFPVAQAPSTI